MSFRIKGEIMKARENGQRLNITFIILILLFTAFIVIEEANSENNTGNTLETCNPEFRASLNRIYIITDYYYGTVFYDIILSNIMPLCNTALFLTKLNIIQ